jgi:glycosyltransferase involved in cell wall biosynthesis
MTKRKIAIVSTHPIQYNAPWFKLLNQRENVVVKVFFTWSQSQESVSDHKFGKEIKWDIPLLEGYSYEFVENKAKDPGSHHFMGIKCPRLIDSIKTFSPDVILVFGWNFISHFNVMRYFKGKIPIWFRGDSTLLDEQPGIKTQLRRIALRFVYRYVDKSLYVGKANKAYFLKHGLKEQQLLYVPHAVDNNRFKGTNSSYDKKANLWREELGYNVEDVVVVFAGKFETKKQPEFLLHAIQEANNFRNLPLKALFVGNGELETRLKEIAEKDKNIQFLPFQNQSKMPIVYRLGNVYCLPSKGPGETWGLAINEAMASCRTVIATDKVGSSQDLIKHNVNGFIFTHNQPVELVSILVDLNRETLNEKSIIAYNNIDSWSYEALVDNVYKALTSIKNSKVI